MKHSSKTFAAGLLLGTFGITLSGTLSAADPAVDGKSVFDRNCSVCHSIQPPPKSAPPIKPIAARYHQKFETRELGINYMVAFMKAPSKEKVIADPQALTRFGLMPAMSLTEAELKAVAGWVWDQYTPGSYGPGSGAGGGKGNCN